VTDQILEKCSTLFNNNYGIWSEAYSWTDALQRQLIGHAFCTWANYNRLKGNAVWITHLVVNSFHPRLRYSCKSTFHRKE